MDSKLKLLLKILGLGSVVILISRLEFADKLYQGPRGLPQPLADIFAIIVIGILLFAYAEFNKNKSK